MSPFELLAQLSRQTVIEVNGASGKMNRILSSRFPEKKLSRVIFVEDENTLISRDTFNGSSPTMFPVYLEETDRYNVEPDTKCYLIHPSFIIPYAREIFNQVDLDTNSFNGLMIIAACRMVIDTLYNLDLGRPPSSDEILNLIQTLSTPEPMPGFLNNKNEAQGKHFA